MKSDKNNIVFIVLLVIVWIVFVGLSIDAGALIVNFVFSILKPAAVNKLYLKLNLSDLYAYNRQAFFSIYSFGIVIAVLKAMLFYMLIQLLHKLDLSKPFTGFAVKKILQISYSTFAIGILILLGRQTLDRLSLTADQISMLNTYWVDSQAFILMAAVVYVIAQIFKRGVELQNDNDLTV